MATHHFKPTRYYNTIGWHEPALRIEDGDKVVTSCVDAWGFDERNVQVCTPGNPMSGPFFVNGARAGDTLAIHLERITPSRQFGFTRNVLATNVVTDGYAAQLPDRSIKGEWNVDINANTATFIKPETKLKNFSLPLNPMPGCFGVAPSEQQAISTATSAEHGGNMDYNGFVAGVTVYFPVFAEGALFHIGDGHALQGDGEIAGTGVEISTEIQFTARVVKKKIGTVRGENADFIFAVGNARPLDLATQIATTEMSEWLRQEYGLGHYEVGVLMGQAVKYDLGNMFDPAYTMVCKMPKRVLAQLRS